MVYKVLGVYKPPVWKAWKIGRDLTKFTYSLGLEPLRDKNHKRNYGAAWNNNTLHAEVRKTAVEGSEGTQWHQDGDTSPGANMDCGLVLWSNRMPTQFRHEDKIYQPKPYEVVLVSNLACQHRRPPEAVGRRWSFRQRVNVHFPVYLR